MPKAQQSVFALQRLRRSRRHLIAGISKVRAGETFRVGSEVAMLPINIFFSKFYCNNKNFQYRHTTLTWKEEENIVKKLLEAEHPDGCITYDSIKDATHEIVKSFPPKRRKLIRFRNLTPSKTFCQLFEKRHCCGIFCDKPQSEAPSVTAKYVVTYFHDLREMIGKDNLLPKDICRLTSRTVEVDIGEGDTFMKYLTVLFVSNATGKLLSTTHFVHDNDTDDAISETDHFETWLTHVTDLIEGLGTHSHRCLYPYHLLLCDQTCTFLTSSLREWLSKREIIVFSIPGIGDGYSGNHDVGCGGIWANKFTEYSELDLQMQSPPKRSWTEGTLLIFVQMARDAALAPRMIMDSFAEAGIFPLDEVRFFKHPRPLSYSSPGKICDMQTMCDMLDEKANDH